MLWILLKLTIVSFFDKYGYYLSVSRVLSSDQNIPHPHFYRKSAVEAVV